MIDGKEPTDHARIALVLGLSLFLLAPLSIWLAFKVDHGAVYGTVAAIYVVGFIVTLLQLARALQARRARGTAIAGAAFAGMGCGLLVLVVLVLVALTLVFAYGVYWFFTHLGAPPSR